MDGRTADQESWIAGAMSVVSTLWPWWVGLFDFHAWREIGAFLVPALFLLAVLMFWGIRRMHMSG